MNASQRRKSRTEKELLHLGRDAKQVRANAASMEEQVRASSIQVGKLQTRVSELEVELARVVQRRVEETARADVLQLEVEAKKRRIAELDDCVERRGKRVQELSMRNHELEQETAELPKLRRRLQEKSAEVADLQKKLQGMEALLKRHEKAERDRAAFEAGAKGG